MDRTERYNSIIAERLRTVVENSGLSQKTIADNVGVSRQAISQYCDGSSVPNADKLLRLAQFFDVSADYLLGLSDTPATDPELKAICKYTGLTKDSIKILQFYKEIEKYDKEHHEQKFIEFLSESGFDGSSEVNTIRVFRNLLGTLNEILPTKEFLDSLSALDLSLNYYDLIAKSVDNQRVKLMMFQQARYSHLDAIEHFRKMIDAYLEESRTKAETSIPDFDTYEL